MKGESMSCRKSCCSASSAANSSAHSESGSDASMDVAPSDGNHSASPTNPDSTDTTIGARQTTRSQVQQNSHSCHNR